MLGRFVFEHVERGQRRRRAEKRAAPGGPRRRKRATPGLELALVVDASAGGVQGGLPRSSEAPTLGTFLLEHPSQLSGGFRALDVAADPGWLSARGGHGWRAYIRSLRAQPPDVGAVRRRAGVPWRPRLVWSPACSLPSTAVAFHLPGGGGAWASHLSTCRACLAGDTPVAELTTPRSPGSTKGDGCRSLSRTGAAPCDPLVLLLA
jgi:hypothetical protein